MAVTSRGRRTAFDNIAVGSATGKERTIAGGGGEETTLYGGKLERMAPGTSRAIEKFIAGTTDQSNG